MLKSLLAHTTAICEMNGVLETVGRDGWKN
jgi:hypothetical protein